MSRPIHDLLRQTSELLSECGWDDKSFWFEDRSEALRKAEEGTGEFLAILQDLDRAVSGMGSLTDLPLAPKTDRMTIQEARDKQWELAEALGDAIDELMPSD
ncbi:MAG: hypothetical protein GY832_04875 [Chloroflexi bacterium]|nr:hypothetical protein [Chloroflexota bacterium]